MVIWIDKVVGDEDTALIIEAKTGIKYTAQTGGLGCYHPEFEGFVLSMGSFAQDFDDCSYGCHHIQQLPNNLKQLADDFDGEIDDWPKLILTNARGFIHNGNCD